MTSQVTELKPIIRSLLIFLILAIAGTVAGCSDVWSEEKVKNDMRMYAATYDKVSMEYNVLKRAHMNYLRDTEASDKEKIANLYRLQKKFIRYYQESIHTIRPETMPVTALHEKLRLVVLTRMDSIKECLDGDVNAGNKLIEESIAKEKDFLKDFEAAKVKTRK